MGVSRARKRQLMRTALSYCGTLVREVVNTYTAFESYPEEEQAFIDEYIVSIGDRLTAQAESRDPRNKTAASRMRQALDRSRS